VWRSILLKGNTLITERGFLIVVADPLLHIQIPVIGYSQKNESPTFVYDMDCIENDAWNDSLPRERVHRDITWQQLGDTQWSPVT
jgi:hypothetical protein